jgi:hypothetical protein
VEDKNKPIENQLNIDLIAHPDIVNPFTEITRRARKYLLLTSFIGFTVTWAGFVPNKIEALGITLTDVNKDAILILVIMTIIYFLSAFWIYANTDLVRYDILRRAGTDNIKSTSGRRLLASQEALKEYEIQIKLIKPKHPLKIGPKLPSPPKEVFEAAKIQEQIQEPMLLYKYSKVKVIFDKYFPIIIGLVCLIFVSLKLGTFQLTDDQLILFSFISLLSTFLLLSLIFRFNKIKKKFISLFDKSINIYNKANDTFIKAQLKLCKKNSKRHQKLEQLRIKLAKRNINKFVERQKKRFDK